VRKVLVSGILGLLLAGCGGAAAPSTESVPPSAAASSAAPAKPAPASAGAPSPAASAPASAKPAAASAPASVAAASSAGSGALRKLKIAYSTQAASFLPVYVAKEAGIYAKHGLDVEISYTRDGPTTLAALVSGEMQAIETGDPAIVNSGLQGGDAEWVAVGVPRPPVVLIAQPEITSVEDLRGKTVGVTTLGSLTNLFAEYVLRQHGLDPKKDATVVAVGGGPEGLAALLTKKIDAGLYTAPQDSEALAQGKKMLVDLRKEYPFPGTGIAVRKSYASQNAATVRDMVQSYSEGVAEFKRNRDIAQRLIKSVIGISDDKLLQASYDDAAALLSENVAPVRDQLATELDILAPTNPKAKDAKPEDFYDDKFAKP